MRRGIDLTAEEQPGTGFKELLSVLNAYRVQYLVLPRMSRPESIHRASRYRQYFPIPPFPLTQPMRQ